MSVPNPHDFRGIASVAAGSNFHNPPSSSGSSSSVNTHQSNHNEDLNALASASGKHSGRPGPADITRLSHPDLIQRVRKLEADLLKLASDHNHMIREANHRIQVQNSDITNLKTTVTRLEEDNAELRDLCCFLDDDRQKGRKLAREWQRFGRYTASVMRQEVAAYQSKLKDLDVRQQQLLSDNQELKELCLYLDEERNQNACSQCGATIRRDDGDGSSSGTNPVEEYSHNSTAVSESTLSNSSLASNGQTASANSIAYREDLARERNILSSQIVEYVKRLERRVGELEKQETVQCPESVLNALQVLQVCQGLEDDDIGDQEKALVRQMCNVVWKKLEDNPKL
ncbi:Coiled-coil domain-containing protein 85A [Orchesella cincta]|uniref:Coiled-coil domain-containing protein 85A n=1 Tax=Orchesella cincta TaxID=48709 RepID=A0A1D2NGA2_ORCCI|nr:Coiled-coil domain-containing protein 85A [Orchesella cincta]